MKCGELQIDIGCGNTCFEGHIGIELASTPEGVVGLAKHAEAPKAK